MSAESIKPRIPDRNVVVIDLIHPSEQKQRKALFSRRVNKPKQLTPEQVYKNIVKVK